MEVVAYIRVSTDEQAKHGLSPEVQLSRIEEFCNRMNWVLVEKFSDLGVSGAKPLFERDGFKKMIEFCKINNIHVVVVYRLDRLARLYPHKLLPILEKLNLEYDILLVPVLEFEYVFKGDLDKYRLFLQQFAMLSAYERDLIRGRIKDAMKELKKKGIIKNVTEKIPKEVQEAICSLYRAGWSIRKLAKTFNLSRYAIERILITHKVISIPEDVCPRCRHRLTITEAYPEIVYYCQNCGFEKRINKLTGEVKIY